MRLVLFDIDGTLLRGQGVGARAMERAGRRLLGPEFTLEGIDFGGALDPWIFREAVVRMGRSDAEELLSSFRDAYLVDLVSELETSRTGPEILPGVAAALHALAADPLATLGLVTGNYSRAAPLKLRSVGIDPGQFEVGAFGDDAPTRPELVRLAIERWTARGGTPDPKRVVVVGDTPRDVDCARKNACRSVAVATGWHTEKEPRDSGADVVVPDLLDLPRVLEALWAS